MLQISLPPATPRDAASLLAALRPHASELLPLAPSATQWHPAAHYDAASLTLVSVDPIPSSPGAFTLHYTLTWHAQLGCSDVSYKATERLTARLTLHPTHLSFTLPPSTDRTTIEEF